MSENELQGENIEKKEGYGDFIPRLTLMGVTFISPSEIAVLEDINITSARNLKERIPFSRTIEDGRRVFKEIMENEDTSRAFWRYEAIEKYYHGNRVYYKMQDYLTWVENGGCRQQRGGWYNRG